MSEYSSSVNSPNNMGSASPGGSFAYSSAPGSTPYMSNSQYSSSYGSSQLLTEPASLASTLTNPYGSSTSYSTSNASPYETKSGSTCMTRLGSSYTATNAGICTCTSCPGSSCTCSVVSSQRTSISSSSLTSKSSVNHNVCPCGCKKSFQEVALKRCEPKPRYQAPLKEPYCGDPLPEIFQTRFGIGTNRLCPPDWSKFGGKILSFLAYTQEAIPESNYEETRTRLCLIRYYLEDNTIEVVEPKTENAGYQQGRLITRAKIPLPKPAEKHVYTLDHLNVSCNLDFYGRVFHIYGVEDNTRYFLNRQGYRIPQNERSPLDVLDENKKSESKPEFTEEQRADAKKRQKRIEELLEKPFQNRRLLKFNAVWDDEFEPGGYNNRKFNIYYDVMDQTVEIIEIHDPTLDLDCLPSFLCQGKLYKDPNNEEGEFYKPQDFQIGRFVDILGKPFLITDADDFTKYYLSKYFNISSEAPIDVDAERRKQLGMELPNGGDGLVENLEESGDNQEEKINPDEENGKRKYEAKPCIINPENVLYQMEGALSFYSKFYEPKRSVDTCRRFIVRFYLDDHTIEVIELPHPNTGIPAGPLFSRQRIKFVGNKKKITSGGDELASENKKKDPPADDGNDSESKNNKTPLKYFGPKHFYIGNIVNINGDKFDLLDADETSLSLMEKYSEWFPQSNIFEILTKIIYTERECPVRTADVIRQFAATDFNKSGTIRADEFRKELIYYSKGRLNEHELKTLIRTYRVVDYEEETKCDMELLRSAIHTELLRNRYSDGIDRIYLERIEYTFRDHDACRTSNIDRETARRVLLGAKLPVPIELVDLLLDNFPDSDDCNRINYCELLEFLNWESPSNRFILQAPMAIQELVKRIEGKGASMVMTGLVNYRAFLEQICPNFHCALSEICCSEEEAPYIPAYPCCEEEQDDEYDTCRRDPCSITPTEREYANLCGVSPQDLYGSGFKLPKEFEVPDASCFQPPGQQQQGNSSYDPSASSKYSHICPGCEPKECYTMQEREYAAMANVCPEDLYGSGFRLPEQMLTNNPCCDLGRDMQDCSYNFNMPSSYQAQQTGNYNCTEPIKFNAQIQNTPNCTEREQPISYQAQLRPSYDLSFNY